MPSALFRVALGCVLLQLASATLQTRDYSSPNAATMIARALVDRGEFAAHAWPRNAKTASGGEEPLRAFHLPAEPLLLATGLRVLPPALLPYLHVPITVLFVTAVAATGFWIGGRALGLAAGAIASLDPFVIAHGAVWDDTFLAAALEWTIFAGLVGTLAAGRTELTREASARRAGLFALLGVLAGLAAMTRSSSQAILGVVALGLIARPVFRPLRGAGWAILLGIAISVAAWGARNHRVLGEFHVGSSHDGITLFESNYATARPSLLRTGVVEIYTLDELGVHFGAVAPMREFDADRYFRRQAIAYAKDRPLDVLATAVLKLAVSLTGVHLGQPLTSLRNMIALAVNAVLILAGAYGWRRWRSDSRERPASQLVVFLCVVAATLTCLGLLAGPAGMRYRVDATGFLYLGAAAVFISFARPRMATHRRA
ncbi:MAG TPA: hypothetical protein VES67_25105 [Vicinamibacterales bacterium]|nr:hypothetical protein [Vicinamibacterales bacterium]